MFLLGWNIFAYIISEDYRFFLKKLKYREDVVYEVNSQVDDTQRFIVVDDSVDTISGSWEQNTQESVLKDEFTFLDVLSGQVGIQSASDELPELSLGEKEILELFENKFVLTKKLSSSSLFDITTQYPDEYREYANQHISLYMFPTKTYPQLRSIFKVLSYEIPFSLNEVNNFWENSFFINLDASYSDNMVRVVLEYKNQAFWLKIKKDSYNIVKWVLQELGAQQ